MSHGILYKYKGLYDDTINHILDITSRNKIFFCHGKLLNDPHEGTIIGDKKIQNLFQSSAILSLTRNPENLLMWSHYARAHYGFCFGFDQNNLLKSIHNNLDILGEPFLEHGDVVYSKAPPTMSKEMIASSAKDVIFNKSIGWSYEEEYRFVVATQRSIDLIPDTLSEVYIGSLVPIWNEKYDEIWKSLSKLSDNIIIKVLGLSQSLYGLEVKDEFKPSEINSKIDQMLKEKGYR